MEEMNNQPEDLLTDLIKINSDRIAMYEKAAQETSDPELKTMFTNIANESRKFKNELLNEISNPQANPGSDASAITLL